jgi:Uncharacterised nucleotidyltransferase
MRTGATGSGRRPSAEGEALLRAGFLPGVEALQSWQELTSITPIEDFDGASHCLLPLVYLNLLEHGVTDPGIQKLKGTYRLTWYKHVSSLEMVAGLLRSFRDNRIDVLVRRDLALALRYYSRPGSRSINGMHLLVPPEAAIASIALLERGGWEASVQSPHALLGAGTCCQFTDASAAQVVLSWRALRAEVDDSSVWNASEELTVGHEFARTVRATDALLDCCGVGSDPVAASPLQRVADAAMVLRTAADQVDWDRLARRAQQAAMVLAVRELLEYLSYVLQSPVPATALDTIATMRVSALDRLEFASPPGTRSPLSAWKIHWHRYRRLRDQADRGGLLGFPQYVQQVWGYRDSRHAAIHAGQVVAREVRRGISPHTGG